MSKKYVKAYFDWIEQTSALSDAEKGRLFISILEYARSGREPEDGGREELVFPTFKATIDRENEISAIRSENGTKGGRPVKANESKQKQNKANESKQKQNKANESKQKQNKANESKQKQNKANESKQKQNKANESKQKQNKANESKQKQNKANESKQKQNKANESKQKQNKANESKQKQNKANESKQKQNKANESKQKPTKDIRHKTEDIRHKTEDIRQKTKTKEDCINTDMSISAEPKNDSAPVAELPLADGTVFEVFEADVRKWSELYPAVDVLQALRSMVGWCDANPSKRKTRVGIARFINTWLSKEQDRGGTKGYTGYKKPEEVAAAEKRRKAYLSDLVEYPPDSGEYRPYWEVPTA